MMSDKPRAKWSAVPWILWAGLMGAAAQAGITLSEPASGGTNPPAVVVPAAASRVTGTEQAAGADADLLRFRNGDALHGRLIGAAAAGGLRWQRSDVREPIVFGLDSIHEVVLAPRATQPSPTPVWVELTNGDMLGGQLTQLDEQTLTLQTWYAGTIRLKRAAVQQMMFSQSESNTIYQGPNSLEEWSRSGGRQTAWTYKKGALIATGGSGEPLARDIKLPAAATIELDLAWRGPLAGGIGFGFDDPRQIFNTGGYMVQFSQPTVYLQRYRPHRGSHHIASSEVAELQRKSKARIRISYSKDKKVVALFLDGKLARQWLEREDWAANGGCLALVGHGHVRISNISVTPWDGRLEEETVAGLDAEDVVRLANGDKVSGRVKRLDNQHLMLAASFAEISIPTQRLTAIQFARARAERARRQAEDVRAVFRNGHRVTLALERLDEQQLTGTSDNFGKLTATLGAFRQIQFRIYDKPPIDPEDEDWGGGDIAAGD